MRNRTPSVIAEFRLQASPQAQQALTIRREAARHIYNACLGEGLRRLDLARQSQDWQRARAMKKSKERTELFRRTFPRFEFFMSSLQKYAGRCRDGCWIGDHLGSHDTQTTR
jgi:hypothetical protein